MNWVIIIEIAAIVLLLLATFVFLFAAAASKDNESEEMWRKEIQKYNVTITSGSPVIKE